MAHEFNYIVGLKVTLSNGAVTALKDLHPGVTDINITSRRFSDYSECVTSCRQLMDDLLVRVNATSQVRYKVGAEVNPLHTGQETLSKDWLKDEVSRLWLYEADMEKTGHIEAIGQARVFNHPATARTTN